MKQKLWIRRLSCGHEKYGSFKDWIANHRKPKIGEICYCGICDKDVEIISVVEDKE